MILEQVQKQLEAQIKGEFIYPLYESYCFSNIPSFILSLLGLQIANPLSEILEGIKVDFQKLKKVVLILIDSLGYKHWLRYAANYEFFDGVTKRGVVAPLTAVFPSTTAAAITTIHSGLTPQEHGLIEYQVYFEEIDKIVVTLPFNPIGRKGKDILLKEGADPKILFDGKTIHQTLAESDVPSFIFVRGSTAQSAYSKLVHNKGVIVPFINSSDLVVNLRKKIMETPSRAYFYVYWATVDTISHTYGPHTDQLLAELNGLAYLLQKEFLEKLDKRSADETVILITADHGQVDINPKETIYLNRYPELIDNFRVSPNGSRILPWGSLRDVYLAIKRERLEVTFEFLTKVLDGKATVVKTEEAIEESLFGLGKPHEKFKSRVGDILILPRGNYTVWYEHFKDEKSEIVWNGFHGGLSADEMLIPFCVAKLSDLL